MNLKPNEIKNLLKEYYLKYEEKNIEIEITTGKVVSSDTYLPSRVALHFDAIETIEENGEISKKRIPLSSEDIEKMMSTMLEQYNNFMVTGINFDMNPQNPRVFDGISISGEKIAKENKKI